MTRYERETSRGRIRGVSRELVEGARELRRKMTPAETLLWSQLRGSRLDGLKFRRQHPLGTYIVDFCCSESRLVIELDGAIHDEQVEYDNARTEYLEYYGYLVVRFRNESVLHDLADVLRRISSTAHSRKGIRHEISTRNDRS